MASSVFMLLALHLLETIVWAASLVYGGLVTSWRAAGFFAGNTYTTVGYGNFVLPAGWEMLAPIIAMSGLFAFGWSGSVLVDIVSRCQRIKDGAGIAGRATPVIKRCLPGRLSLGWVPRRVSTKRGTAMADIDATDVRKAGTWVIVWGVLLIVTGIVAIMQPAVAALAFELLLGWLLVFAGIVRDRVRDPGARQGGLHA